MYKTGDHVVYSIHGVCRVADLEMRLIDRKQVQYYALEPVNNSGSRFLVPTENALAVSKMHRVLSREELDALLHSAAAQEWPWIVDENERRAQYRDLVNNADRFGLLQLIGSLYRHKEEQTAAGRKFRLGDEIMLRDAVKLMNSEVAFILCISPEQAGEYVRSAFAENE